MIALDSNLLVYAHRSGAPQHEAAKGAIERAARLGAGWGIPLPCVAEFWSVVTHPSCEGGPSTGAQARGFLEALVATGGGAVWYPGRGFQGRLLSLAADLHVRGVRIFDLQIALTAFDNGATEIWTHDAAFLTFPGISAQDPLS